MSYTVTLHDFPEIPVNLRQQAERKYGRVLEKALGGPEQVALTWKAWSSAEDAADCDLTADDKALAVRWQKASAKARQEGFNDLGEAPEAYFEVRLER